MSTWSTRIRDLMAAGMKQSEIGAEVGLATSTISDLANGRTKAPGGEAAIKLFELHRTRCANPAPQNTAA